MGKWIVRQRAARLLAAVLAVAVLSGPLVTTSVAAERRVAANHKKGQRLSRAKVRVAKKAFKTGQRLLKRKQYAGAIVEFRKAHEITHDGLVMGQVALAFEKAGDYRRALEALRTYRGALPQSDRGSVDEMVARYEQRIAAGKSKHLRLPGEPEPVAAPPPTPAPAPVVATPLPPATPALPKKALEPDAPRPRKRLWTWIAAGTAGAFAVGAIVMGLNANSKFDELDGGCGKTGSCTDDQVSSVRSRAVATDILWGTALAAGVTAGVLFFLEGRGSAARAEEADMPRRRRPEPKDAEDEDSDLLKDFRLSPLVGGGTFGLGASFRY